MKIVMKKVVLGVGILVLIIAIGRGLFWKSIGTLNNKNNVATDNEKVDPAVVKSLKENGEADIIVILDLPDRPQENCLREPQKDIDLVIINLNLSESEVEDYFCLQENIGFTGIVKNETILKTLSENSKVTKIIYNAAAKVQ